MVSKNNFTKKIQIEAERKPHYGIRKFSIGVASVLLSTSLYFGVSTLTSNNVFAATQETTQETDKANSDQYKNITQDSSHETVQNEQNTESKNTVNEEKSVVKSQTVNNDVDQRVAEKTDDELETKVENDNQNTAEAENKKEEKPEIKSGTVRTQKINKSSLKAIDPKTLSENKISSQENKHSIVEDVKIDMKTENAAHPDTINYAPMHNLNTPLDINIDGTLAPTAKFGDKLVIHYSDNLRLDDAEISKKAFAPAIKDGSGNFIASGYSDPDSHSVVYYLTDFVESHQNVKFSVNLRAFPDLLKVPNSSTIDAAVSVGDFSKHFDAKVVYDNLVANENGTLSVNGRLYDLDLSNGKYKINVYSNVQNKPLDKQQMIFAASGSEDTNLQPTAGKFQIYKTSDGTKLSESLVNDVSKFDDVTNQYRISTDSQDENTPGVIYYNETNKETRINLGGNGDKNSYIVHFEGQSVPDAQNKIHPGVSVQVNPSGKTMYFSLGEIKSTASGSGGTTRVNPQIATLRFVDDDEHPVNMPPTLPNQNVAGVDITFPGLTNYITQLKNAHFVVHSVVDNTENKELDPKQDLTDSTVFGKFINDPYNWHTFTIHVGHETMKTGQDTQEASETIHYKYDDQSQAKPDYTNKVTFTRDVLKDEVTGETKYGEWDASTKEFSAHKSPDITGYTPDHSQIDAISAAPGDKIEKTVIYSKNNQTAKITYYDIAENNRVLKTDNNGGKFGDKITFPINPETQIQNYEEQGYKLFSNNYTDDSTYQADNKKNEFKVCFVHDFQPVNPLNPGKPGEPINPNYPEGPKYPENTDKDSLNKTITRTIHYVTKENGQYKEIPDHSNIEQNVTYTASGTLDKVTGKFTVDLNWNAGNSKFNGVESPEIPHYKAVSVEDTLGHPDTVDSDNNKDVKDVTPTSDTTSYDVYVVYENQNRKAKVVYQDVTKLNNPTEISNSGELSGDVDSPIPYSTKNELKSLTDEGYVLVSNGFDPNGTAPSYKNDKSEKTYYVKVKHGMITVTPDKPGKPGDPINPNKDKAKYPKGTDKASLQVTVPREIEYLYSNGTPKAGQPIHDPFNDSITFNATKVIDKVTGKVISTTWDSPKDFGDKDSPKIDGYTASREVVCDKNVKYKPEEKVNTIIERVFYTPDEQKAHIKFVDATTGKVLGNKDLTGHTAEIDNYRTKPTIDDYIKQGYELVSDNYPKDGVKYDNIDGKDQFFEIHFKHGTTTTTSTKEVKRTINYVDQNGNKMADPVNDSLKFTETKIVDNVTGKTISDVWTPAQNFLEITSPEITGYTPDRASVSNNNIDHNHDDIVEKVVYTADPVNPPENKETAKPNKNDDKPENKETLEPNDNKEGKSKDEETPKNNSKKIPKVTSRHEVEKHSKSNTSKKSYNENFGIKNQEFNGHHSNSYNNTTPLSTRSNGVVANNGSVATVQSNSAKAELPQTGEKQNNLGLLGLAFASIAGLISLALDRKRKS